MADIVMDILDGLDEEDRQEISELSKPMVGDQVFSQARDLEGEYGGGEISAINEEDDEIEVSWWDKTKGGFLRDTARFERLDLVYHTDGKAGRVWYII